MKRLTAILLVLAMALALCGCGHEHTWTEATCTEPKKCTECSATEGEPLGHDWTDATCTKAKTCNRCGETEGEPLGHKTGSWKVVREATLTDGGKEELRCSECGEVVDTRSTSKKTPEYKGGTFNFKRDEFVEFMLDNMNSKYSIFDSGDTDPLGGHAYGISESGTLKAVLSFIENSSGGIKEICVWGEGQDAILYGIFAFQILCGVEVGGSDTENLFNSMSRKGYYTSSGLKISYESNQGYNFLHITGA